MSTSLLSSGECRFCGIVNGAQSARTNALDTPWLQSPHYAAISSVGGFIPGWSLIVPRSHRLNLTADYDREDFVAFTKEAISLVEAKFGRSCIFEHGTTSEDSETSCGTAHAHLHVVPFAGDLESLAEQFDESLEWKHVRCSDLAKASAGSEYLFVANEYCGNNSSGKLALLSQGRSQYFRRVLAQAVGKVGSHNYREDPCTDQSLRSAHVMHGLTDLYREVA